MSKRMLTVILALAVIATSVLYTYVVEAQVVTDGLISFWTFDSSDTEGETTKDVWGGNDGTVKGDPQMVAGEIEEALEFDGVGDYVETPFCPSSSTRTLCLWVNPNVTSGVRIFAGVHDEANHRFFIGVCDHSGSEVYFFGLGGDIKGWSSGTAHSFNAGTWYHVALVADGSTARYYVNGKEVDSLSYTYAAGTQTENLVIGAMRDKGKLSYYTNAAIDEVKIYDRALSEAEIQRNYKAKSQLAVVEPASKLAITWGKIKAKD